MSFIVPQTERNPYYVLSVLKGNLASLQQNQPIALKEIDHLGKLVARLDATTESAVLSQCASGAGEVAI